MTLAMHLCRGNFKRIHAVSGNYESVGSQPEAPVFTMVGGRQPLYLPAVGLGAQLLALSRVMYPSAVLNPSSKLEPAPALALRSQVMLRSVSYRNTALEPATARPLMSRPTNVAWADVARRRERRAR